MAAASSNPSTAPPVDKDGESSLPTTFSLLLATPLLVSIPDAFVAVALAGS
jgi:hypothetical protein